MKSSLRYKFIGLVFLAVAPFLIYAIFDYLDSVRERGKIAIERNAANAEEISQEIEDFINTAQSVLYSLALHPAIINNNIAECDDIFKKLLPLYPLHQNILAVNMQGVNFASAVNQEKSHGIIFSDDDWFKRGSKGVSVVTDSQNSKLSDQPSFMITMPVFTSSGEQTAVLGFPVDLNALQEHFFDTAEKETGATLTVIDNNGTILISTLDSNSSGKPYKRASILRKLAEAKSGSLTGLDTDGFERYYSFSTIESTGWKVLVGVKASRVYAESNSSAFQHLIFFVSICLAVALAALWYSRQLGSRIDHLIEGLNRAASGDLGVRLSIPGKDEVTAAGEAFNRMAVEREKAEEEIREFAATLEKRVQKRTLELSNSKNELEAFSYAVSHDLQEPVRHIMAFSQILIDEHSGDFSENSRRYLLRISKSGLKMRELITHLLDLSQLNQHNLDRTAADIYSLSRSICADFAEAEPQRKVEIVIGEGRKVDADPALLSIALQNLLGNAWKYTAGTGYPRIEVGETVSKGTPCFFVRDNGSGFDMEYVDRLFVPFQRLHSPGEFEGSGVGLATVMRIVQRHGGSIWAESSPGKGAVFYFTLGN